MIKTTKSRAMHKIRTKHLNIIALTYCFFISDINATVIVGDPDATAGNTFSFNVGHAKHTEIERIGRLWMASGQAITNDAAKQYALSYAYQLPAESTTNPYTGKLYVPTAIPMANNQNAFLFSYNDTTKLVETTTTPNPIYGAHFSFFDIYTTKPVFILKNDLSTLYYGYDIEHQPVQTETKFDKTELLTYSLGTGQTASALLGSYDGIYLAYSVGTFGTDISNIAKFITNAQTQKNESKPQPYIQLLAQEQISINTQALLGGGAILSNLGENITLQGIATMTYAGVQATATIGPNNTAAGLMIVNTVEKDGKYSLNFSTIATDQALSKTFNTIVSSPSEQIRIKNITGMQTSTSLNYIIVARDNGTGPQNIYAAPLVSNPGTGFGQIADSSIISNNFSSNPPTFTKRTFTTPLTDPTQIQITGGSPYLTQITVGGGTIPLSAEDITGLYAVGDSVYVVIGSQYDALGTKPGTFYSQAILAQDGHIVGWSPWARVIGSDNPMIYSNISSTTNSNYYVCDSTGAGTSFKTVEQTMWTTNQNLSNFFKYAWMAKGGTQGIFNFGQSTPGFNNEMSIIATTGFNNVALGQTGYTTPAPSSEFKIKTITESDVVPFNDIGNSGAIVALEIADDSLNNHWLFAGGITGLYALTDKFGVTKNGNFATVADFSNNGQTWNSVGNFTYIKKLISDKNFLYILTPTCLYQISLDPNKFINPTTTELNPIKILTSSQLSQSSYLLDIIIDNGFCILGTTNGMYSFNIENSTTKTLNKITIPSGLPAVTQLFVTSTSNTPQKSFKKLSNLHVLNNNFYNQQSRVNRFIISNSIIEPFNDSILNSDAQPNGIPTSFIRFNQYTSNWFTDGSWNLASNYFLGITEQAPTSPSILQVFSNAKNGQSSSQIIIHLLSTYVPTEFLKNVNNFLGIIRESTSGACIASGNFPTRINA